jgi:hypothetical protein
LTNYESAARLRGVVPANRKTEQLQIRVGARDKAELQRRASAAGMSVSAWVLAKALPAKASGFKRLLEQVSTTEEPSFVLAEINDFLAELSASEFHGELEVPPPARCPRLLRTYVAAMVEHAAAKKRAPVPRWALDTPALEQPYFASRLRSLRLHLLAVSPPAFRRRNLFVDASVGDRV